MKSELPKLPLALCGGLSLLAGCAANPGPAPVEEFANVTSTPPTSTATAAARAETLSIGIDQINAGLNPHLGSDDSVFVRELADLVLPSAFIGEVMNTDLLSSAEIIEPYEQAAQTVRYVLQPEAQWSDGTPITVADFQFLWEAIVNNPDTKLAPMYEQISAIRSSQGGRSIEVDFSEPVVQWQQLFQDLLPAHAMNGSGSEFSTDLISGYPASGGRYQLTNYDQQRGIITLERNDRFWGEVPTSVEQLQFVEIRSATHGAEMLRSGQVDALNITPSQTAAEMYQLIPGTRVSTTTSNITWRLTATEQMPLERRREVIEAIDIPVLNRLALQRTTQEGIVEQAAAQAAALAAAAESLADAGTDPVETLPVAEETAPESASVTSTAASADASADATAVASNVVRIGVNPQDNVARLAARVIVDMLQQAAIEATVVESDPANLYGTLVPQGEVDMVLTHNAFDVTERFGCPSMEYFFGYCDPAFQQDLDQFFDGQLTAEDLTITADELVAAQALETTLAYDERLSVLGSELAAAMPEDYAFDTLSALVAWQELQEN